MKSDCWQFWIDVGGTFTDCAAWSPDGGRHRIKVLSSARVKIVAGKGSTDTQITGKNLRGFPDRFWHGYRLVRLGRSGEAFEESTIINSDSAEGMLHLGEPFAEAVRVGESFEIRSDEVAPLLAIRMLLGIGRDDQLPPVSVRLGTTRGTNALLTRTGARTAFITTRGFGDALHIGDQQRPNLFELGIRKRKPLFESAVEIDERIAVDGQILNAPDRELVRTQLSELKRSGIESLAVCLLHAWKFPAHEKLIGEVAKEFEFANVSLSHQVSQLAKFVSRAETTVLDAYLNPVLVDYLSDLHAKLGSQSSLRLINSEGGLMNPTTFTGKDSILSGPAGGVVGFSKTAASAGFEKSIGFDMGGTSTDVSRYDGQLRYERESLKSGVRIITPVLAIETVAAGGGSICRFDGTRLVVGPESAGADPGPACYGRGGPLTVTDLNLFLGRIVSEQFPFTLDKSAVERRLVEIAFAVEQRTSTRPTTAQLVEGFLEIANTNMAAAIRTISVAEGFAADDYTLVGFGGAAPQHVCAVADELGIQRILIHPDAGILSAYGIGLCDVRRQLVKGVYKQISGVPRGEMKNLLDNLKHDLVKLMRQEHVAVDAIKYNFSVDLRYMGTEPFLTIEFAQTDFDFDAARMIREFNGLHQRRYGYVQERDLEIVAVRGLATSAGYSASNLSGEQLVPAFHGVKTVHYGRGSQAVYERNELNSGDVISGPALIADQLSTTFVASEWIATVLTDEQLLLTREVVGQEGGDERTPALQTARKTTAAKADPAQLEIFNNHFVSIARQMGVALQNTSVSVNVKERLDFSCAIFDQTGRLVVNAPHVPVHLGAMGETVRQIILDNPSLKPGDVFVTNDPFRGGSHLPDVTVVTPVHSPDGKAVRFFMASRAHHAEIGGLTPGSMPPFSKTLADEGVLISDFLLLEVENGTQVDRFAELRELLSSGTYPSRNPDDNIADIQAQVAANKQGVTAIDSLVDRYGWPMVSDYLGFIQQAATTRTRAALSSLPDGEYRFKDCLDNGAKIVLVATITHDNIEFDFSGTDAVLENNFNANPAIVSAAIMYCVRCIVGENLPLNDGILDPVRLILPECFLNPPHHDDPRDCAAVVAGNVETSQRIVDMIFGALGICAASQGTMNNLLFGDSTFGYYETICGGEGATKTSDGADAVHTHMTNTRMTDPEILEQRFPVRLLEFSIRRDSGGAGEHRGGCGVVRRIEFLKSLSVAILTSRRDPYVPYGLNNGLPGKSGRNRLIPTKGEERELDGCDQFTGESGDQIVIETPGGGGFNRAEKSETETD